MENLLKKNRDTILILLVALLALGAGGYFYYRRKKGSVAIGNARKFVGKEEIPGNQGFQDKKLEAKMKAIGWAPGAEWCAFYVRMVLLDSLSGKRRELADKLLNGSSQQTYLNLEADKSGYFEATKDKPKSGAIVIWQQIGNPAKGHAGLVTKVNGDQFETIEGNLNLDGSDGKIAARKYSMKSEYNGNSWGCVLRGFINIKY